MRAPVALSLVLATFAVLPLKAEKPEEIPPFLGLWNNRPIWVALEEAIDTDGTLRADTLGQQVVESRRRQARENTTRLHDKREAEGKSGRGEAISDCQSSTTWAPDHFTPTSTLQHLATYSDVIVAGTVVSERTGFLYDTPGTLYVLKAEYLKGNRNAVTLLFYPYSNIRTADGWLCSRPLGQYRPPKIGDRVLAFAVPKAFVFGEYTLLAPHTARELVHEEHDGTMQVPHKLRDVLAETSFDDLRRQVERLIAGQR